MATKNARHSKENPNWETPQDEIECARAALGGTISLDPFSCARANLRVGATHWFGPDAAFDTRRDGFTVPWGPGWLEPRTVFVNPPGGTIKRAWRKVCAELVAGNYTSLIWIGFSVEQVCILSEPNLPGESDESRYARGAFVPSDFSICFLRNRIHFIDGDNPDRPSRPGHANAIFGVGTVSFEKAYRERGQITDGDLADPLYRDRALELARSTGAGASAFS